MRLALQMIPALCALATAAPRISPISPAPGLLTGGPVAWDLDQDGDLDLAFLPKARTSSSPSPPYHNLSSHAVWLRNIGNRRFAPPKTFGLTFGSRHRSTIVHGIIPFSSPQEPMLASLVLKESSDEIELHTKSVASNSWTLVHRFSDITHAYFLKRPVEGLPIIITQKTARPESLELWELTSTN